jgi:hypothetical protein
MACHQRSMSLARRPAASPSLTSRLMGSEPSRPIRETLAKSKVDLVVEKDYISACMFHVLHETEMTYPQEAGGWRKTGSNRCEHYGRYGAVQFFERCKEVWTRQRE